jgi:hypothetical protein
MSNLINLVLNQCAAPGLTNRNANNKIEDTQQASGVPFLGLVISGRDDRDALQKGTYDFATKSCFGVLVAKDLVLTASACVRSRHEVLSDQRSSSDIWVKLRFFCLFWFFWLD